MGHRSSPDRGHLNVWGTGASTATARKPPGAKIEIRRENPAGVFFFIRTGFFGREIFFRGILNFFQDFERFSRF